MKRLNVQIPAPGHARPSRCYSRTVDHKRDFVDDTAPQALEFFYELQRRRSIHDKARDVFELSEWMIRNAEAGVRLRHPSASQREVFLRAAALRLPREAMTRAYGWDPLAHE